MNNPNNQRRRFRACSRSRGAMRMQPGLLVVGLFKLTKAAFFTAVGVVAFHLIQNEPGR